MYFVKSFVVLAAAAVLASATPGVDRRVEGGLLSRQNGNNCQNYLGDCFYNGCSGVFANPSDTTGICTAGTFSGCPCSKCGSESGYVGSCSANGCDGIQGTCTAGTFQGCPCD